MLTELVSKAEKEITLIDNYVDVGTLNILTKKREKVIVHLYTMKKTKLSETDVNNFNQQYPVIEMHYTSEFHDRFLIVDETLAYHIGASIKDAGKKCFAINRIEDKSTIESIVERLQTIE